MRPLARRALEAAGLVLLVVASMIVGAAGCFVQGMRSRVGELVLPWGLALAVAATVALLLLVRAATRHRWVTALAVLGWSVGVVPLTLRRPEGDLVVTSSWTGLAFLLLTIAAAGVAVALPQAGPQVGRQGRSRPGDVVTERPGLTGPSDSMGTPLDR